MKYIITESKLEQTIMNYFDEIFDVENIKYINPLEDDYETGEEWEDENRLEFYLGDYYDDDNSCFKWYDCGYFNDDSSAQNICPTVSVESPYVNSLNGYFGDMWQEPFKKWIKVNFDLPVKTIEWW
jgi:hypothetical protein